MLAIGYHVLFDGCRRSSATALPVKYEWDSKNVIGTFARSKNVLTEKLTNGALVTPTPGRPATPLNTGQVKLHIKNTRYCKSLWTITLDIMFITNNQNYDYWAQNCEVCVLLFIYAHIYCSLPCWEMMHGYLSGLRKSLIISFVAQL